MGLPFPAEPLPLPCTWLCSGSGLGLVLQDCFMPEPPCGCAVRGVLGEAKNCGKRRAGKLCGTEAFQMCLSVPTVSSCGNESFISICCLDILYLGGSSAQSRDPNSCLSQFWACQEPNAMSRVLKIDLGWLRLRSGVHYLRRGICFVYT